MNKTMSALPNSTRKQTKDKSYQIPCEKNYNNSKPTTSPMPKHNNCCLVNSNKSNLIAMIINKRITNLNNSIDKSQINISLMNNLILSSKSMKKK